jgi:glycerophosphoryl diester phosphodiesterase
VTEDPAPDSVSTASGQPQARPPRDRTVSRRTMITALGVGVAGVAAGGGWYASRDTSKKLPTASVAAWVASRGNRYFIAHRGSGDVIPEHTMPAYQAALDWHAPAMEISTSSTSDGVLICMHDLTYDRTTNLTGTIHDQPSSVLQTARVVQPQLGPAWTRPPLLPRVPLLEDVLKRFGGRIVLCIEAKRDADYDAVMALVDKYRLHDSVIVKLFHTSSRVSAAQAAGYPVFLYLGSNDISESSIGAAAGRLRRTTDYLVIPTTSTTGTGPYLDDSLVGTAVDTGLPVWMYPVHRRSEAAHYFDLGAQGCVSSSVGYNLDTVRAVNRDGWASERVSPGEMSRQPDQLSFAPTWPGQDELSLHINGRQQFMTLGQFSPVAKTSYRVDFAARWDVLPNKNDSSGLVLAFAHTDDRYYQVGLGQSSGYQATSRSDGVIELSSHSASSTAEVPLDQRATARAVAGEWMTFRLDVTPTTITWARLDLTEPASVTTVDTAYRGGYLHVGRASTTGSVTLRQLRIH